MRGADFRARLSRQNEFEFVDEEGEFRLWLGVTGQEQLAAVGDRDVQVNHLHGGELFDGAAWRQAEGQRVEPPVERDVETLSQEGDKDVRLDARLVLVKDRPNGEVPFEVSERRLDTEELEI